MLYHFEDGQNIRKYCLQIITLTMSTLAFNILVLVYCSLSRLIPTMLKSKRKFNDKEFKGISRLNDD
jgi:hypothetical protein